MTSKENATVLRNALRLAFGHKNVSVRIATGTAGSWLHTEVKIPKAFDCLSPGTCDRNEPPCKMCDDKYRAAKHKFDSIVNRLKESNQITIPTFPSDDGGIGQAELDCHISRIKLER